MKILHLLTLNTQGLRDKQKKDRFITYVNQQKSNIVFMQETHFTEDLNYDFCNQWHSFSSFGTTHSKGVSILINKNLNVEILNSKTEADGRIIMVNVKNK